MATMPGNGASKTAAVTAGLGQAINGPTALIGGIAQITGQNTGQAGTGPSTAQTTGAQTSMAMGASSLATALPWCFTA